MSSPRSKTRIANRSELNLTLARAIASRRRTHARTGLVGDRFASCSAAQRSSRSRRAAASSGRLRMRHKLPELRHPDRLSYAPSPWHVLPRAPPTSESPIATSLWKFGCGRVESSIRPRDDPSAGSLASRSPPVLAEGARSGLGRGGTNTAAGTSRSCSSLARSRSGRRPQRIQQDARDVVCLAPLALEDHSAL